MTKSELRKITSACKCVIASSEKRITAAARILDGVFMLPNDRPAVCDGFRLYMLKEIPPGLPLVDDSPDVRQMVELAADAFDRAKLTGQFSPAMTIPTVECLRRHIKAAPKSYIVIDSGFMYVNPRYLLEILVAFPAVVLHRPQKRTAPIYFDSPLGDGLLFPLRTPMTEEEKERNCEKAIRR